MNILPKLDAPKLPASSKSGPADNVTLAAARSAGVKPTLEASAQGFEALFIQTVLSTMHDSKIENDLFTDESAKPFQGMLDHAYAELTAKSMNTGLRDAIMRAYSDKAGAAAASTQSMNTAVSAIR